MAKQGMMLWGRYRLLDVLGDGGMARVFRAEDTRLNRIVAVKVLHEQYISQAEFVRRFEQEAQLAAGLSHPNIAAIYDVGRDDDTYFIVMEYVEGSSLKALITQSAPLPLDRAITIMRQIGLALDYAHAHSVIHRDIKPENILLTPSNHVKVSDFGIARALASQGQTATGMVLGSVSYFSPEQAQGKQATAESDLYSSGIVLYEMLTGRLPFAADNPLATAMQHITQQPAPPRTFAPKLPPAADAVVLKAISKNPSDRFHSGAALADALTVAAVTPVDRSASASIGRMAAATPPQFARTMRVPRAGTAVPARRSAPIFPLLLLLIVGGGAVFAVTHRHDISTWINNGGATAAGSTPTSTATASLTAMPPRPSATALPVVGAPSATSTASSATLAPSATASPSASATAGTTPSPSPSALPSETATSMASAGSEKHLSADIVTAAGHTADANGVPAPDHPQDTFNLSDGQAFAIIHIHHLPAGASVGARWTFPSKKTADIPIAGSYATYWVNQYFTAVGQYSVSALVNGKPVGAHRFKVVDGAAPHAATQTSVSGAQAQVAGMAIGFYNGHSAKHVKVHKPRGHSSDAGDGGE